MVIYKVKAYTGTRPQAGTSSSISIRLHGLADESGQEDLDDGIFSLGFPEGSVSAISLHEMTPANVSGKEKHGCTMTSVKWPIRLNFYILYCMLPILPIIRQNFILAYCCCFEKKKYWKILVEHLSLCHLFMGKKIMPLPHAVFTYIKSLDSARMEYTGW